MRKALTITLLFVALFLAVAIALLYYVSLGRVDPVGENPISPYDQRHFPEPDYHYVPPKRTGDPLDPQFAMTFNGFKLEEDAGKTNLVFDFDEPYAQHLRVPEEVTLSAPDWQVDRPHLKLKLRWLALAQFQEGASPKALPFQRYNLALEPIATPGSYYVPVSTNHGMPDFLTYTYQPQKPGISVTIGLEDPAVQFNKISHNEVRDAVTGQPISGVGQGWGISNLEERVIRHHLNVLHDVQPQISFTVRHGPLRVAEFEPLKNPVLETPHFRLTWQGTLPGNIERVGGGSYSFAYPYEQQLLGYDPEAPGTLMIFSIDPPGAADYRGMQAFSKTGEPLKMRSHHNFWHLHALEAPLEELGKIRVEYTVDTTRVTVNLPRLPTAPNAGLSDLRDLMIPLVEIRDRRAWLEIIENLALVKVVEESSISGSTSPPTVTYPLTYTDITLGRLMDQYMLLHPGQIFTYNPADHTLYLAPPPSVPNPWDPAVEWVRDHLKKP